MNNTITQAIREHRVLELRYSGYSRIVEPHAYGRDNANDEILRCYQVSGGSSGGEGVGWKLLKVREIFSLNLLKDNFIKRNEYKRGDKAMEYVFEQL
jgi:hypothetical protein